VSPHPQGKKAKAAKARRAQARGAQDPDRAASKRDARLERQVQRRRHRERAAQRRRLVGAAAGVVAVAVIAGGGWLAFRPDPELAGVTRPPGGRGGHVAGATYDTPTPTGGPHDGRAPACGTYDRPLDPTLAVHGLEHGAVVLWYDAGRPELGDQLARVTEAWDSHVIISANEQLDRPVVATAWGRLKAYDTVDPEIDEFVRTYRRRGPEREPCDL